MGGSGRRFLCRAVLVMTAMMAMDVRSGEGAEASGWEAVPGILKRIQAPTFPAKDFDVKDFGAVADGVADCRKAIGDAIEACAKAGGGRVVLGAGTYVCNGPVHLKSGVNLYLAEGATLLFGTDPDFYLVGEEKFGKGVLTRWEGTRCYNFSPLIYAYGQKNIAVTGKGVIDGQANKGWAPWVKRQEKDKTALRKMGTEGVAVEKRIFGRGHFLRPSLFQPYACENVLLEGVTVKQSPFWTIHPVLCKNVTVRNVTVGRGTTNDDGCDPESCTDVLIEGCTFTTADDNIAIKAGRDNDAWAAAGGKACENIVIRSCTFYYGAPGGVSIGSEMSGDVRNVFVEKCSFVKAQRVLFIKANPDRGGVVENVFARDLTVKGCEYLLQCEMDYKGLRKGKFMPVFRNFQMEKVTCESAGTVVDVEGLPEAVIKEVVVKDVTVEKAGKDVEKSYVEGLVLENVKVGGQKVVSPP